MSSSSEQFPTDSSFSSVTVDQYAKELAEKPHDTPNSVIFGNNLESLQKLPDQSIQVVYIDPPFNTGRTQQRQNSTMSQVKQDTDSSRHTTGFGGKNYQAVKGMLRSYDDSFENYWDFLEPRLYQAWRLLDQTGTLYLHLDWREVHYAKVMCDGIFGRDSFINEIIWAYDYGGKSKSKWPTKHDNILVYVKDPDNYYFDSQSVDREPYMAPGLVTAEKNAKGKLPTDVWWHTIVSPTGKEKTGYPTQKPLGVLKRMINASSQEGNWVLDFFGGSGTTADAASQLGRRFITMDQNLEAISVMKARLQPDTLFIDGNL